FSCDWSADVCFSDLYRHDCQGRLHELLRPGSHRRGGLHGGKQPVSDSNSKGPPCARTAAFFMGIMAPRFSEIPVMKAVTLCLARSEERRVGKAEWTR